MALLDMAFHSGAYIEAAHVNYHKRGSADRDEEIVRSYCHERGIPFHLLDFDEERYSGNFQAAARQTRYDFFRKICEKDDLDEVLVAHQKDDLIETYLMQKEKRLGVSYFGIKERNTINGVRVYRPLLDHTKNELISYCEENGIPYGIDESNLKDAYQRNRIRHLKVDRMSEKKKDELVEKIRIENQKNEEHYQKALSHLNRENYTVKQFLRIPYLKTWLHHHFSHKSDLFFDEMKRQLEQSKSCVFKGDDLYIAKGYGRIEVFEIPEDIVYRFDSLDAMRSFSCEQFMFAEQGKKIEGVFLKEEDFPIRIRPYREGDSIALRYGQKKINRFFIDRKMTLKQRLNWPLMVNAKDEIIFVPSIGCDLNHYCEIPNIFMIKL